MDQVKVVLVTVPDNDTGTKIANAIVEARLAACVNIIPAIHSIYHWKGKLRPAMKRYW